MSATVSDFMLERLSAWGVERVYGYPGDGINGILGAFERHENGLDFVQVPHEEVAAFMACAHAKFTGKPGVCMATSGPGAIHLLNGLYDAKLDHQPVVAIVGQQKRAALGGHYQQEVDLISLFKDVAGEYVHYCMAPEQMRHLVDRALRIAMAERTVTCIVVPADVQELDAVEKPPRAHATIYSGMGYSAPRIVPADADLRRAADALNAGERVAMLVGAGALKATDEVIETAEILGAGVAKALLGRAAVPDDLPFVTGQIGLLGTRPSWDMMMGCDTLLMVGSSFPYSEFLPPEGQARGVQIDIDGRMLSIRYPMEVNLVGDSAETLKALKPLLRRKQDRSWREQIEHNIQEWWQVVEERAMTAADPINPERVLWELSPRLPDDCIISADSGSVANWFARNLKIRRGMMATLSGTLATMCPGVPYALAAKFTHPERVSIALVGDGAMQMLGNNCLITAAKYWKQWADPRLVILVLNNRDLNQVTWEQRVLSGDPKWESSQNVMDFPYAGLAEMIGLKGIRVEHPDEVGAAWDEALHADRPCVLDVVTDPKVPPLPPHITYEQAKHYASSLLKGDREFDRHRLAVDQGEHAGRSAGHALRLTMPRSIPLERLTVSAHTIPTDFPEADGTLAWDRTTIVIVRAQAGGRSGLGYSYTEKAAAELIDGKLRDSVEGQDALAPTAAWRTMVGAIRNLGRPGIASAAIAAVDVALWDLKARLLDLPLVQLLGAVRETVPVYGSGGFTSYPIERLQAQLGGWAEQGIGKVKMKVGSKPEADPERVGAAREAIGPAADLFVDANGAYDRKQALAMAEIFAHQYGVSWFEEPVSSDDLEGLRLMRDRAPAGMDITAGEYGYDLYYFRRMLEAGAVDVLQPDCTRCGGVTGFMHAAALCRAYGMPLSAHTAPSIHAHLCCAALTARHIEYFHDHVRIEEMLFDGAQAPRQGELRPDLDRPGLGLELKELEAARFAI